MGEGLVVEWPGGRRLLEALVFWSRGIRSHLGAIRKGGLENPAVSEKRGWRTRRSLQRGAGEAAVFHRGAGKRKVRGEGAGAYGTGDLRVYASVGDGFGVEARAGVHKCNPIQTSPNPKARPKPGRNRRPAPPRSPLRHKRPPAL